MLTSREIRQSFIDYFGARGHAVVASSSLVPIDDPTLLFTNAGMNQFKDVFLGIEQRDYRRAVTSQKCIRAGGKHNDLDTVGRTPRHHTFFEMLGNFSFGDYFKREAIAYAWEYLTAVAKLSPDRLWATVYLDDDEAFDLWQEVAGVSPDRIVRLGEKDNFWSMGDTGPCGPCSEIIYDRGLEYRCQEKECALGKCDCGRWLEIWNLVFMQYDRDENGVMNPLPRPSIDTGMGLERLTSILQGVESNYETDLFTSIIKAIEEMTGQKYQPGGEGFPFRVIADHIRACTFLVIDGVLPGNEGRAYVLRRILRRAVRFGKRLGLDEPFFFRLIPVVIEVMGAAYPEIKEKQEFAEKVIRMEEERFFATLSDGLRKLEDIIARLQGQNKRVIPGPEAFMLYDTFGFPIDLTEDVAEESGLLVDKVGFEAMMTEQKERGRKSFKSEGAFALEKAVAVILEGQAATDFVGYQCLEWDSEIVSIIADGQGVEEVNSGEAGLVLLETPFYAEGGGQTADHGVIQGPEGRLIVRDVQKIAGWFLHSGQVEGVLRLGQEVNAKVDRDRRMDTAANHTATHLLHKALRLSIGEHAQQKGSLVEPERFRFDFSHFSALTADELSNIEELVNREIWALHPVHAMEISLDEAREMGAVALFGEKYGDQVRMVEVEGFSRELCGGTHVKNTGEIGLFKILSESSIGSGLRRIEALTGEQAWLDFRKAQQELYRAAAAMKAPPLELTERIDDLTRQLREREKELENLKNRLEKEKAGDVLDQAVKINDVSLLTAEIEASDMNSLRQNAEMLRDKLGSSVVVLGARLDDKVGFVAFVSKDLNPKGIHAGEIVGQAARIAGGGGGGRPDMAQAGGKEPAKIKEALAKAGEIVAEILSS
ncbi:MAG: alanine--tRNA ligase [Syntrophomonadaceae bacterium]|nr:alanine--tRNA ligase [Syntrophomonadaceae bacterium]